MKYDNIIPNKVVKKATYDHLALFRDQHFNGIVELIFKTSAIGKIKIFYLNGKVHNENGPAWIHHSKKEHDLYYLNGIIYGQKKYYEQLYKMGKITQEKLMLEML